jgi:branched-chain amino acid transport system substrate-binding protein
MSPKHLTISRRGLLGAGAGAAFVIASGAARSEIAGPVRIGALLPLTGAGGIYGPPMANLHKSIVEEVNAGGGILGQHVDYFFEDDQTNPDAGVLAVRKLIDVDNVCAVMGLWSSAVAAPTLSICWQNKVMMIAIAASDSLAELPHQGYFIRTNVHVALQGEKIGEWALAQGAKNVFILLAQNPFSEPMRKGFAETVEPKGVKTKAIIYDSRKTSFRTEVDQVVDAAPDLIFLGGYPQDNIVIMKDLYRTGYKCKIVGTGTGITGQFLDGAGKEVAEGIYTVQPSPVVGSPAYAKLAKLIGKDQPDTNMCQSYDQINLVLLSVAAAQQATGTAIRDTIRSIGDPTGEKVDNVLDGLKLLGAGKKINYEGASGPCKFLPNGNVASANFRTFQVKDGKLVPA